MRIENRKMKNRNIRYALFALVFSIIGIMVNAQENQKQFINSFLDQWHKDAADINMADYFEKISDNGIFVGTDATEVWTKQEFYDWAKPHFEDEKTWDFKSIERNVYLNEDKSFAWFDEKLKASYGELRGSGVLKLENGSWKIQHYVLSLPVPNEKFREVIDVIDGE